MARRWIIGLAVLLGLGGFLHARISTLETTSLAYYVTIFDSGAGPEITDTDYPSLFPSTFQPFGGRYIMHFGTRLSFDGPPPAQVIVIEFDSMHDLLAWHSSDAFKRLYDVHKIGHVRAFAVEGVRGPGVRPAS